MLYDKNKLSEAVHFLKQKGISTVDTVVVLGSGLSHIADNCSNPIIIPYDDVPYMKSSAVAGHSSRFVFIQKENKNILYLQGRMHMYEGYTAFQSVFPVAVSGEMGASFLILTNAAGSLNPELKPGDIMMIEDHIKMQTHSPLEGIRENNRFVDMQNAYDVSLYESLSRQFKIKKGIYLSTLGPQYETPAEVRYFRKIGGDAVGMSTVMETIMGRFYRMNVMAFSMITNAASGMPGAVLEHSDVVHQANHAGKNLGKIIDHILDLEI